MVKTHGGPKLLEVEVSLWMNMSGTMRLRSCACPGLGVESLASFLEMWKCWFRWWLLVEVVGKAQKGRVESNPRFGVKWSWQRLPPRPLGDIATTMRSSGPWPMHGCFELSVEPERCKPECYSFSSLRVNSSLHFDSASLSFTFMNSVNMFATSAEIPWKCSHSVVSSSLWSPSSSQAPPAVEFSRQEYCSG